MPRFQDLLRVGPSASPPFEQPRAYRELASAVEASRLRWWRGPDELPASGTAVLAIVAPWSHHDLALLDVLDESAPAPGRSGDVPAVHVSNMDDYRSVEELRAVIPILDKTPRQTPIAAVWRDGAFRSVAIGAAARDLVADALGLSSKAINEEVASRIPRYSPPPEPAPRRGGIPSLRSLLVRALGLDSIFETKN